jgi:hypothetical protein
MTKGTRDAYSLVHHYVVVRSGHDRVLRRAARKRERCTAFGPFAGLTDAIMSIGTYTASVILAEKKSPPSRRALFLCPDGC